MGLVHTQEGTCPSLQRPETLLEGAACELSAAGRENESPGWGEDALQPQTAGRQGHVVRTSSD